MSCFSWKHASGPSAAGPGTGPCPLTPAYQTQCSTFTSLAPPSGSALTIRGDPGTAPCSVYWTLHQRWLTTSPFPRLWSLPWEGFLAASICSQSLRIHPPHCILARHHAVLWNTGPGCTTRMWGPWVFPLATWLAGKEVGKTLLLSRRSKRL